MVSVLRFLKQVNIKCPVIFTTAYDQYAIEAFKVNSIDYLLKPVKKEELEKAVTKFKKITPAAAFPSIDINKLLQSFSLPAQNTKNVL